MARASPLLRWAIDLDSQGSNLRVKMTFATGAQGTIHAGMPFDVVARYTGGYWLAYPRERARVRKIAAFRDWVLTEFSAR